MKSNLKNLLVQKTYVDGKVKGLSKILPTLKTIKNDAENLVLTINKISESSEDISSKIRSYDVARVSINILDNF